MKIQEIAKKLGLTSPQVKQWFQDRREKQHKMRLQNQKFSDDLWSAGCDKSREDFTSKKASQAGENTAGDDDESWSRFDI